MDDSQIIDLFFERSEQAIAELSQKYGRVLLGVAQNILNDRRDAEETVNDAYLGVWNTVPPERPVMLQSYACRIVRNLALKKYHANTAKKRNSTYDAALDELSGCLPSDTDVESEFAAQETMRLINAFLSAQTKEDRMLFVRRYWYADSVGELAERFGIGKHTVSVRLSRLRARLKSYLAKEGVSL